MARHQTESLSLSLTHSSCFTGESQEEVWYWSSLAIMGGLDGMSRKVYFGGSTMGVDKGSLAIGRGMHWLKWSMHKGSHGNIIVLVPYYS